MQLSFTVKATETNLVLANSRISLLYSQPDLILGDPGADKGGEGNSKRVEKYIWNEEK